MATGTLAVTGDPDADRLVNTDPLALLLGMLLDQQVPMEWAFKGPRTLHDRLGGLDCAAIAAMDPDEFEAHCRTKPAIHRFPASMAKRIQAVCAHLVEHYEGDAEALWRGESDGAVVFDRLRELPGYGEEKSKIFLAILVKRMGIQLDGWERRAGAFADDTPRSVADIDSPESLARVREWKKAQKAKGKTKQQ